MRTLLFILLLFIASLVMGQKQEAVRDLQQTSGLRHAVIGISVKRVRDGASVLDYNGSMALTPASVTKLFPTIFALMDRGAAFTYTTRVVYRGSLQDSVLQGDILVQAGGDPCLDSKYFPKYTFVERLLTRLQELGVKRITGRVRVQEGSGGASIPGSWPWEDVANHYGAIYHPFNYRDNAYNLQLHVRQDSVEILPVRPRLPRVTFLNQVRVNPAKPNDVWLYGGPHAARIEVRGTLSGHPLRFSVKGAMHHPAEVFERELTDRLCACGIVVEEKEQLLDSLSSELLTFTSPVLAELVFYTNKRSVNLFAEALGKLVAADDFQQGVKRHLTRIPTDTSGLLLKDASGLSPLNAVPAETFTDLLVWAYQHADPAFWRSLPEGGVDGGLAIYSDHPLLGARLRAKTGSLSGVRALSGYLTTQEKELLAFTVLVNHYTCPSRVVQEAVRDFLVGLSRGLP